MKRLLNHTFPLLWLILIGTTFYVFNGHKSIKEKKCLIYLGDSARICQVKEYDGFYIEKEIFINNKWVVDMAIPTNEYKTIEEYIRFFNFRDSIRMISPSKKDPQF